MSEKNDFEIDMGNLDEEWKKQPRIFHEACVHAAEKQLESRKAKALVKLEAARIKQKIRNSPAEYGVKGHPSVDQIESLVETDSDYQNAVTNDIMTAYQLDLAEADVNALNQKRQALENEVKLHCNDYNSEPRIPKGADNYKVNQVMEKHSPPLLKPRKPNTNNSINTLNS